VRVAVAFPNAAVFAARSVCQKVVASVAAGFSRAAFAVVVAFAFAVAVAFPGAALFAFCFTAKGTGLDRTPTRITVVAKNVPAENSWSAVALPPLFPAKRQR